MNSNATKLTDWLAQWTTPARGLIVPVSGGSDSALLFWALNQVCPEKTIGVFAGDGLRSAEWFRQVGTLRNIAIPAGAHKEVRLWAEFLSIALTEDRWLVGSRTRTEHLLGTYSLASRLATFLPLAGTWKTDVMKLCNTVGVPSEITDSSRRADPDCGRPLEMSEIALENVDVFLRVRTGELDDTHLSALTPAEVAYLDAVLTRNSFKRSLPTLAPALI